MPKIDTLSPSLISGVIGYVATGNAMGFWIGSVGLWFGLTALFVISAALANRPSHEATPQLSAIRGLEIAE